MKKAFFALLAVSIPGFILFAQVGPGPGAGPANSDNGMEKLFAGTPVYSATMITAMSGPNGPMTVKTKTWFDHENSRTEMNMADVDSASLPPGAAAHMKALGMDDVVTITTADKKNLYVIYPNLSSYVSMPSDGPAGGTNNAAITQTTKLGEETVDGHPCVKNKYTVNVNGDTHEFTAWNATDLNNFPIKIAFEEQGMSATITFQNISFDKIPASQFQPPPGYSGYPSMAELMRAAVATHPGAMPGAPVPAAP